MYKKWNLFIILTLLLGLVFTSPAEIVEAATASADFTFTSSLNPSNFGQSVTFTVSATGDDPTYPPFGYIYFYDNGNQICGTEFLNFTTGPVKYIPATCTISSLAVGTHVITAYFSSLVPSIYEDRSLTLAGGQVVNEPVQLSITPTILPDTMYGDVFNHQMTASYPDGSLCSTCFWTLTAGSYPTGLFVGTETGNFSGTPTALGTFNFTLTANDRNGMSGSQAYTVNVNKATPRVTVIDRTIPSDYPSIIYLSVAVLHPSNNTSLIQPDGNVSLSLDSSPIPGCSGSSALQTNAVGDVICSYNASGLSVGNHNIQADFTPSASASELYTSGTGTGTLKITYPPFDITGLLFNDLNLDGVRDWGESPLVNWAVHLDRGCDGTNEYTSPTYSEGNFYFYETPGGDTYCLVIDTATGYKQMTATSSFILDTNKFFQIGFAAETAPIIDQETLPNAEYQTPYSQQLSASGGIEPYAFALINGALPSGISLDSNGLLSGFADSPAALGTYPITIGVKDANGFTSSRNYNFVLDKGTPEVTIRTDANISWHIPFSISAEVLKKTSDGSFAVLDGTVAFFIDDTPVPGCGAVTEVNAYYQCANVSMDLSVGTHTVRADYTPTGWYTGYYYPGSGSNELTVQPISLSIPGSLFLDVNQNGIKEEGESTISESDWTINLDQGCDGEVDYSTNAGWGNFNFSNIPVSGQCHRITVIGAPGYQQTTQLADFYPVPGELSYIEVGFYYPTIIVNPSAPGTYTLPSGTIGVDYSQTFSASGGTAPYVYTIAYGSLPAGLTLSNNGTLSGTPTVVSNSNFTVRAEDAQGAKGQTSYSLTIERVRIDGDFTFTSSSNPSALGEVVTFTVSATGSLETPEGVFPPIGFITFFADGSEITGCSNLYLNLLIDENGMPMFGNYPVTCITDALGEGSHEITATYYDWMSAYNEPTLAITQVVNAPVSADLSIDKTDSKDPVKPGSKLVYSLMVSNLGSDQADSVIVTDKLDVTTTFLSVSAPRGWTCSYAENSGTVTCTTDSLASGSTAIIKITVLVNKTAKLGKELVNNAFVSSSTFDPDLTNNAVVQKTLVAK